MSFSSDVKEELSRIENHESIAGSQSCLLLSVSADEFGYLQREHPPWSCTRKMYRSPEGSMC